MGLWLEGLLATCSLPVRGLLGTGLTVCAHWRAESCVRPLMPDGDSCLWLGDLFGACSTPVQRVVGRSAAADSTRADRDGLVRRSFPGALSIITMAGRWLNWRVGSACAWDARMAMRAWAASAGLLRRPAPGPRRPPPP